MTNRPLRGGFPQLRTPVMAWLACACLAFMITACQGEGRIPILVASAPTETASVEITASEEEEAQPPATSTATRAASPTESPVEMDLSPESPPDATRAATRTPRPSATLTITPGPSPTATRTPTRTATATRTRWPTITRTITLTPTPPAAVLRISRPGLLSKVSSPFRVEAVIKTGDDGKAWLHLIGEDGRILTEQALDFGRQANQRFAVSPEVGFEISGAAETGRLIFSSRDAYGRTVGLSSVDLILMKAGSDEINPPVNLLEPYLVRQPRNEAVISGGAVLVSGLIRPVNATPVIFELIDTAGRVVGSTQMTIEPPEGDLSHSPFQTIILYNVTSTTPARLALRQESDRRLPGTIALWSMPLTLEP
jgi:hypothetical protein